MSDSELVEVFEPEIIPKEAPPRPRRKKMNYRIVDDFDGDQAATSDLPMTSQRAEVSMATPAESGMDGGAKGDEIFPPGEGQDESSSDELKVPVFEEPVVKVEVVSNQTSVDFSCLERSGEDSAEADGNVEVDASAP